MAVKAKRKKIIIAALSALGCVLSHLGAMAADAVAATDSDIGKVIGADGVVYASVADAEDAQTTAYAMNDRLHQQRGIVRPRDCSWRCRRSLRMGRREICCDELGGCAACRVRLMASAECG